MPRPKKIESEYSFIGIEITGYSANVDSSINYEVRDMRKPDKDRDTKVYKFDTTLEIKGRCTYPEKGAGETYFFTVRGTPRYEGQFSETLKDCHVIDKSWREVYRTVKGRDIPVYDVPKSLGHLEKGRGTQAWTGWLWLPQQTVTDMLALLPHVRPLYLSIHKRREEKMHHMVGFSLQTTDPAYT